VITTLAVGDTPVSISVNPNINLAYVANQFSNTVSIIDGKRNVIVSNITLGRSPSAVSINPNTNLVYVANSGDNTLSIINGTANKR